MTGQIPQPEWFDLTDELDRIAGEAGLTRDGENWSWPDDFANAPGSYPFIPSGFFEGGSPPQPDPNPLFVPQPVNDPQTFTPEARLFPFECGGDMWAGTRPPELGAGCPPMNLPQVPTQRTVTLPSTDLRYDNGGYSSGGDEISDDENSPGDGGHHPPPLGIDISAQRDGRSTRLAPAKPIFTENDDQSEQPSDPAPSGSRGCYNRARNSEEKKSLLARIREALKISPEDELSILCSITRHLRGTVEVDQQTSSTWLTKAQRQAVQRRRRRQCFDEMRRLVCPEMTKNHEVKILQSVLKRVRTGEPQGAGGGPQTGVFRAY